MLGRIWIVKSIFSRCVALLKVGFEDMRNYLSQDEQMAKHFSGSTADKAAWVLYQKSCESEILKDKAHQKALEKSSSQTVSGTLGNPTQSANRATSGPSPSIKVVEKRAANKRARNASSRARKKLARGAKKVNTQTPADK